MRHQKHAIQTRPAIFQTVSLGNLVNRDLISGDEAELWTGEQLEHREVAYPGDYIYIPAGVPHVAVNRTETPMVFIAARTDPNEQESVVMRPDLEAKVP